MLATNPHTSLSWIVNSTLFSLAPSAIHGSESLQLLSYVYSKVSLAPVIRGLGAILGDLKEKGASGKGISENPIPRFLGGRSKRCLYFALAEDFVIQEEAKDQSEVLSRTGLHK